MDGHRITLIGGGLAGSLLAIYLARRGFTVDVWERRGDMRKGGAEEGRSINLALSTRGIFALKEVGLHREILSRAIPMRGRMMHSVQGELTFQPYGKDESDVIYSISRSQLNVALMDAAESTNSVAFHFNERCTGMDIETGKVSLHNEITGKESAIEVGLAIGTDGSASALRTSIQKAGRCDFSQDYLDYGYKELTIPAGSKGNFQMERDALHIWPRKTFMLIALPNIDGSFTCILFYPFEGKESFERLATPEAVRQFFRVQFPDASPLMPSLVETFFANSTGSMVTIRCFPWHVNGRVLLLGDAAHAIVPFFGQGMNCAFEDCTVLNECIDRFGTDWKQVFGEFERLRKPNTDAIAEMALENFIEMRDLVADPQFLLRKKVELELERRFPGLFISRYSMVTFQRIPYAVALERGKIQDRILAELSKGVQRVEGVDWEKARRLIRKELTELKTTEPA